MHPSTLVCEGDVEGTRHTTKASLANTGAIHGPQPFTFLLGVLWEGGITAPRKAAALKIISAQNVYFLPLLEPLHIVHRLIWRNNAHKFLPICGDVRSRWRCRLRAWWPVADVTLII